MTDVAADRPGSRPAAKGRPRRRLRRTLRRIAVAATAAALVGLAVGFVGFARGIAGSAPPADPHAEGIVVLTGDAARIDAALQLLVEKRAHRLLISGVNPSVTRETLAATVDRTLRGVLLCCVDIDRRARDTIENAEETRRWADELGFNSLIVVTSAYHMPRSLSELADAMPGKALIAYPIVNPERRLGDWWRDPEAFGLVIREYGKYLFAEARQLLPYGGMLPPAAR